MRSNVREDIFPNMSSTMIDSCLAVDHKRRISNSSVILRGTNSPWLVKLLIYVSGEFRRSLDQERERSETGIFT
jgi:hypothetical protein